MLPLGINTKEYPRLAFANMLNHVAHVLIQAEDERKVNVRLPVEERCNTAVAVDIAVVALGDIVLPCACRCHDPRTRGGDKHSSPPETLSGT